ncbi:MAG: flavodoxin domain-containing protein [Vampirovibrionales bacterium]|nr:flavodoxin domain-containing protein [Vampirovibrionales bacterium]
MKMPIQILKRLSDEERSSLQAFSLKDPSAGSILIAWASETGTAERLAFETATALQAQGLSVMVLPFSEVSIQQLTTIGVAVFLTSTWGDGDPPTNGEALLKAFLASTEPLPNLRYTVCAVGDSAYPRFCQCGKDLDIALEQLGATRLAPLATCDIDVEPDFNLWLEAVLDALSNN